MSDWTKTFEKEVDDLRRVRDELQVQMHLAGQEAKDGFQTLEKKWEHLEGRAKVVAQGAEGAMEDVGDAAKLLLEEFKNGYRRIKDLL
jgi:hypothetical protein